jgi:hypothetical protein
MSASGENRCPPVGRNRCPLTRAPALDCAVRQDRARVFPAARVSDGARATAGGRQCLVAAEARTAFAGFTFRLGLVVVGRARLQPGERGRLRLRPAAARHARRGALASVFGRRSILDVERRGCSTRFEIEQHAARRGRRLPSDRTTRCRLRGACFRPLQNENAVGDPPILRLQTFALGEGSYQAAIKTIWIAFCCFLLRGRGRFVAVVADEFDALGDRGKPCEVFCRISFTAGVVVQSCWSASVLYLDAGLADPDGGLW